MPPMQFLVQSNLFREAGHARLLDALDRLGAPYTEVQAVAFTDRLFPAALALAGCDLADPTLSEVPVPLPPARVFALGSYKLARIVHAAGGRPGAYFEGLRANEWALAPGRLGWPPAWLLNAPEWVGPLRDARVDAPRFVRPVADSKVFRGRMFTANDFAAWLGGALRAGPSDPVNGDTQVLVVGPREILSEARFWVVGGLVVTQSTYKRGGQLFASEDVDWQLHDFASCAAHYWSPNPAYVLDVASTPDGPRIVEANCLSAAGFYAADMQKLVDALARL